MGAAAGKELKKSPLPGTIQRPILQRDDTAGLLRPSIPPQKLIAGHAEDNVEVKVFPGIPVLRLLEQCEKLVVPVYPIHAEKTTNLVIEFAVDGANGHGSDTESH